MSKLHLCSKSSGCASASARPGLMHSDTGCLNRHSPAPAVGMSRANSHRPAKGCRQNCSHPAVSSGSTSPPEESRLINPPALLHWNTRQKRRRSHSSLKNHVAPHHYAKHLQSYHLPLPVITAFQKIRQMHMNKKAGKLHFSQSPSNTP